MTVTEKKGWYLEYEIEISRSGLLGDVSSLSGMLGISIAAVNDIDQSKQGLLIRIDDLEKVGRLEQIVRGINEVEVTKLKKPELRDRLTVRHGRCIEQDTKDKKTSRFERKNLGLLIDFLAELLKGEGHKSIGIRGMSRVDKTESVAAGSVYAHKRWLFVSSTLMKRIVRSSLIKGGYDINHVYIIDGAVAARKPNPEHREPANEVVILPSIEAAEHLDLFVKTSICTMEDFDYITKLRENENQEIHYEEMKRQTVQSKNNLDFGDLFDGDFGFFE